MKRAITGISALAIAAVLAVAPAQAAPVVYMTGTSDPWGRADNDAAMNTVFGTGNWTKYNGFDASVFTGGNSFIFLDGSAEGSADFNTFISANQSAIASYLAGGGRLLANAARWYFSPGALAVQPGYTLSEGFSYSGALTAAGVSAGLGANGAGSSWTGNYFSHDTVSGGTCYITGTAGCTFSGGAVGGGALFVGGITAPSFQSGGDPAALRSNQLSFVSGFATGGGAVPEPATWAMLIFGFGAIGAALRRRQKVTTTVRFA